MTQPQQLIPGMNHRMQNVIRDRYGRVIAKFLVDKCVILDAKGRVTTYTIYDNIELVSGHLVNPAMCMGRDPPVLLRVCEACRKAPLSFLGGGGPSHGLCSAEAGHECCDCQAFLCPGHAKRCGDGEWRCSWCAWLSLIKRGLGRLFLTEGEDE